jgi:hypothetical protein
MAVAGRSFCAMKTSATTTVVESIHMAQDSTVSHMCGTLPALCTRFPRRFVARVERENKRTPIVQRSPLYSSVK